MNLTTFQKWTGSIVGGVAVLGILWKVADATDFRPVYKRELQQVAENLEQTATSVLWLQYSNFLNIMDRRPLTDEEKVRFCQIVSVLAIPQVTICQF